MNLLDKRALAALLFAALAALGIGQAQDDALAKGKVIYEETAGGVGCAYCHGLQGKGDGTAGLDAPAIIGLPESTIRASLAGAYPVMDFIELSEDELSAVVLYLQYLTDPASVAPAAPAAPADGPAAEPAEPDTAPTPEGDAPPTGDSEMLAPTSPDSAPLVTSGAAAGQEMDYVTVNVDITEAGFVPASVHLSLGQRVQLVVRNRTGVEHHYDVLGMKADDILWIADPMPAKPDGMSEEDHDAHHAADFVPWRAPSIAGIEIAPNEVHAWTYEYAPGGGKDVLRFTPTVAGTYKVVCPLHPGLVGEVVVF